MIYSIVLDIHDGMMAKDFLAKVPKKKKARWYDMRRWFCYDDTLFSGSFKGSREDDVRVSLNFVFKYQKHLFVICVAGLV